MKTYAELLELTREYGGEYGANHSKRLVEIVHEIGSGMDYDRAVIETAAALHDWGAYAPFAKSGIDHVVRSVEVVRPFMAEAGYAPDFIEKVMECVANHHNGLPEKSLEARLFSDADAIDYLGVVGVLRDFSKSNRDMRKAYQSAKKRAECYGDIICTDAARKIAEARIQDSLKMLKNLETESYGLF